MSRAARNGDGVAPDEMQASPGDEQGGLLGPESDLDPTVSVVLPTMNEEEGIAHCIERVEEALATLGVSGEVIVSDSSTDRTPEIARERGAIVVEPDERGYGYAYQYAFERCRGDYVAMGDADTTYDFAELPKLYRRVAEGEADIAMGSRLEGEIEDGAMPPLHRYVGNPLLTRFLNVFYGAGVSDAHSGMRVLSREALERLDLDASGMEFASEMIMEASTRGMEIAEEPIVYHEREGEATLDSFRDGWRHVRFMLVNAPGYLFSVPGALMTAFGLAVMAVAAFDVGVNGVTLGPHAMLAGSLATLAGSQVASLGVFATVAGDPIRTPADPVTTWITESVRLEHGATAGVAVFAAGAGYAAWLLWEWITSGYAATPMLASDVLAFTAIVLGLQLVFGSFFMSAVAEE